MSLEVVYPPGASPEHASSTALTWRASNSACADYLQGAGQRLYEPYAVAKMTDYA